MPCGAVTVLDPKLYWTRGDMTMTTTRRSDDAALAKWAEDPTMWGAPAVVLRGDAAAAHGRAVLEAAGVDIRSLVAVATPEHTPAD